MDVACRISRRSICASITLVCFFAAAHPADGMCSLDALTAPDLVIEDARPVRFEKDITRKAMAHLAADNLIGYLVHGQPLTPLNPEVMDRA